MSLPRFEHEWDGFKGHVAVKWDKLNEDELINIKGNFSGLIELIAERYGEKKTVIEANLNDLYATYLGAKERIAQGFNDVRDEINERTQDFADNVRSRAAQFQQNARDQINKIREENIDPAIRKSEDYIKVHPFSTVLGAFGVGLLIGGIIGLLSNRD
jgi:ElaB/YqjD/DUF883 family membrane-anchored ribosome-binding protein/uncharacterized protein YjbJ (UPF0337 family)